MNDDKPCDICRHVRAKGEAPGRVVYYCTRYDQRTQAWETCNLWEREPGSDDEQA
jgi:hypothetical protein